VVAFVEVVVDVVVEVVVEAVFEVVVEAAADPPLFKIELSRVPTAFWLFTLVPEFKVRPVPTPVPVLLVKMLPKVAVSERRTTNMTATRATRRQVRNMIDI